MMPLPLAAGDYGVRAPTSLTCATTGTAGNYGITLIKRLAEIPIMTANVANLMDAISMGLPQIVDDAGLCLMLMCSSTTSGNVMGSINIAAG